jgi:3'(2'), 5'-bisphosphate nucleotidase
VTDPSVPRSRAETARLLEEFVAVACDAARVIMRFYGGDLGISLKADASPATVADREAEALLVERLSLSVPGIPMVAEEAVSSGRVPAIGERFILIDPLDGTKEFIQGRTDFTVNIALVEAGAPVLGVIAAPARNELFGGVAGAGAWRSSLEEPAQRRNIGVRQANVEALVVVASVSHSSDATQDFIERFRVQGHVGAGSSIKFCQVASGEADLYPRLGRTMEWDTAAGDAILRAAGGRVETLDGKPLTYGKRNQADDSDFANPFFVAASSDWTSWMRRR